MRKYTILILLIFSVNIHAQYPVHDAITYIQETIKAIQDEIYQSLDLDVAAEQLDVLYQDYAAAIEQLNVLQQQYQKQIEIYEAGVKAYTYIGDPSKLAAFLNSKFVHSDMLSQTLNLSKKYQKTDFTDEDDIINGLNSLEHSWKKCLVQEDQIKESKAKYTSAKEVTDYYLEGDGSFENQMAELETYDVQYDPQDGDLANTAYANYKVNTWTANAMGQWMQQDMIHKKLQQEQMYTQNCFWERGEKWHKQQLDAEKILDENLENGVNPSDLLDKELEELCNIWGD